MGLNDRKIEKTDIAIHIALFYAFFLMASLWSMMQHVVGLNTEMSDRTINCLHAWKERLFFMQLTMHEKLEGDEVDPLSNLQVQLDNYFYNYLIMPCDQMLDYVQNSQIAFNLFKIPITRALVMRMCALASPVMLSGAFS